MTKAELEGLRPEGAIRSPDRTLLATVSLLAVSLGIIAGVDGAQAEDRNVVQATRSRPSENVSLNFAKIRIEYKPQKPDGTSAKTNPKALSISKGYDKSSPRLLQSAIPPSSTGTAVTGKAKTGAAAVLPGPGLDGSSKDPAYLLSTTKPGIAPTPTLTTPRDVSTGMSTGKRQ
jgi:hypothetical protein